VNQNVLQGTVRGTDEPHKLTQLGATPSPATNLSAAGQPVLPASTNSACRTDAAHFLPPDLTLKPLTSGQPDAATGNAAGRTKESGGSFFAGKGLPAGRVISGAPPHDGALPSRTARARFFFSRLRNAVAARVLTGTELNAVRPTTTRTRNDCSNSVLQLPPSPAQFFVEPRPGYVFTPQPRRNPSTNSRGLRLAWLLGLSGGVK